MSEEALLDPAGRPAPSDPASAVSASSAGGGGGAGLDGDDELVAYLERDQLVTETFRPLPRAHLGRGAVVGLWALRVFVVLVSLMVVYTFFAELH
jgi:hypothetical protein